MQGRSLFTDGFDTARIILINIFLHLVQYLGFTFNLNDVRRACLDALAHARALVGYVRMIYDRTSLSK
jgi:hypothetical protein